MDNTFYEDIEICRSTLGRTMANFGGKVLMALTISAPNNKLFLSLTSLQQKQKYKLLLKKFINKFPYKTKISYVFEFNKKGNVHLHGLIQVDNTDKQIRYIEPLVLDTGKIFHQIIDIRLIKYQFHTNEHGVTFNSPFVHIDHVDDDLGLSKWIDYMEKGLPPVAPTPEINTESQSSCDSSRVNQERSDAVETVRIGMKTDLDATTKQKEIRVMLRDVAMFNSLRSNINEDIDLEYYLQHV